MTSTESQVNFRIDDYVAAVASHLSGLPADERAEMLEDLREHLNEVSRENPDQPLVDAVGTPTAYAKDLLSSAGVTPTASSSPTVFDKVSNRIEAVFNSLPFASYLRGLVPVLQPFWWVLRAYIASAVALSIFGFVFGAGDFLPVPNSVGALILVTVLTIAVLPLSISVNKWDYGNGGRLLVRAANVFLGAVLFLALLAGSSSDTQYIYENSGSSVVYSNGGGQCLADSSGRVITNLYAYDPTGALLNSVLLYDQSGRPIDNLCPDQNDQGLELKTEYAKDANGAPIYNVFPRVQSEAKTDAVTGNTLPDQPVVPPAIVTPKVAPVTTTTAAPTVTTTTAAPTTEVPPVTTIAP